MLFRSGLSSIGSLLSPTTREDNNGLIIDIDPTAKQFTKLKAPIAPGLFEPVAITNYQPISLNENFVLDNFVGTLAYDGEREITVFSGDRIEIALDRQGPRTIDMTKTIENIAYTGLLINDDALQSRR